MTGKRIRHYQTFATEKEAQAAIAYILGNKSEYINNDQTLADFLEEWLEITKRHLNPSTHYTYRRYINVLQPYLKGIKVAELKRKQAEIIINKLLDRYKPNTVKMMKQILSTAYNRGVEW